MSQNTCTTRPRIGGQAIMEGVMMNGEHHYSVAVRKQNGEIQSEIFDSESLTNKGGFFAWPLVRGVIRFVESLVIGIKTLDYSADLFIEEDEAEEKIEAKGKLGKWWQKNQDSILTTISMLLAVVIAVGLFLLAPMFISKLLYQFVFRSEHHYLLGLIEGLIRMSLFLLYIFLVSRLKDIARVFQYHGAEHKTINTFEDAVPLTVENVRERSRFNKRCGTSFLFIVMFISILVFSFIQITDILPRLLAHLLLIPLIGGVSYELLRFSAKTDSKLINALVQPGLWIQHITTNEPDDEQIAVAIESVRKLMETEHPEFLS